MFREADERGSLEALREGTDEAASSIAAAGLIERAGAVMWALAGFDDKLE
jgi:hypothetical protein